MVAGNNNSTGKAHNTVPHTHLTHIEHSQKLKTLQNYNSTFLIILQLPIMTYITNTIHLDVRKYS